MSITACLERPSALPLHFWLFFPSGGIACSVSFLDESWMGIDCCQVDSKMRHPMTQRGERERLRQRERDRFVKKNSERAAFVSWLRACGKNSSQSGRRQVLLGEPGREVFPRLPRSLRGNYHHFHRSSKKPPHFAEKINLTTL